MVFVTGATGLLGSHLLYFLAVSGHSVSALRRKQSRLEDSGLYFYSILTVKDIGTRSIGSKGMWCKRRGWPNMSGGLTMFITVPLWCLFRGRIGCI